jgi:mxaD protein
MKYSSLPASLFIGLSVVGLSANVFAAEADALKVQEEVVVNAPAAKVWDKVSNFGDLGAWHPAVKKTEIVSGTNNKKGAERLLTLQDGGTIKEKLLAYNTKKMTFKYSILEGVLPVSKYASTVSVKSQGENQTLVVWQGTFKRKDLSATPAAGQDDATAIKTMTSVYRGGLDNLKKISE